MNEIDTPEIVIEVKLDGQLHKRNLSEDLAVDEEHINVYLQRAPGLTAYWNTLLEKQRSIVQRIKVTKDRKFAELSKHYRSIIVNDTGKVSNAQIEANILSDPDYQKIEDELLDNQEKELLLKGAVEAIRELRSTLISLSANMRQAGNISIKSPEANYRDKFRRQS